MKALRTERTRVEGAIQNMFDLIEQGIVSPRDADFTARLANQRTRRADLEQETLLVERQLSTPDRRVEPDTITITDSIKPLELAANDYSDQRAP